MFRSITLLTAVGYLATGAIAQCWVNQGCVGDSTSSRLLQAAHFASDNMTVEACTDFCSQGGFNFAGLEFGRECYCDYSLRSTSGNATEFSECSMPCSGDQEELCGGSERLILFSNGDGDSPAIEKDVPAWLYQGCFTDSPQARALERPIPMSGQVSASSCTTACQLQGFTFAGLEFADECWCGNAIAGSSSLKSDSECTLRCTGDHSQICGDADRINIYQLNGNLTCPF